jgi:hypothetical protein
MKDFKVEGASTGDGVDRSWTSGGEGGAVKPCYFVTNRGAKIS